MARGPSTLRRSPSNFLPRATPMSLLQLFRHQQACYPRCHRDRCNVRIHLLTVPVFQLGNLLLLLTAGPLSGWWALPAAALMLAAMAAQGRGHAGEALPAEPFTGALNIVQRILLEQWLTFPRFVLRGGWRLALSSSRAPGEQP